MAKSKSGKPVRNKKSLHSEVKASAPIENKPTETNVDGHIHIHSLSLIIGSWKKSFAGELYKTIVAQALNDCTHNWNLMIGGYLITQRRVCLILQAAEEDLRRHLQLFYASVQKEIRQHRKHLKIPDIYQTGSSKVFPLERPDADLFFGYPLFNDHLMRLITGRTVRSDYYDHHLARLKDHIHLNNFCSAKDYLGGKSPVIVKLISDKEWIAEFNRIHKPDSKTGKEKK